MSSRALKKLQRQKDLSPTVGADIDSDQESEIIVSKPQLNLFDLLDEGPGDTEDEPEEENDEDKTIQKGGLTSPSSKKKKKKKGKGAIIPKPSSSTTATTVRRSEKTTIDDLSQMSMQELERTLKELNQKLEGDFISKTNVGAETLSASRRSLLSVDTRFLDADAEMKRMFGSRVVNNESRGRNSHARTIKKSILTNPRVDWPRYDKHGLGMDLFETIDGISHFAFTHSPQYQDVQYQFFECVATHDPNTLVGLLQRNPYHVDCLLQLSEVAKHSGDWQMAGEFIERALYAFERSFHTQFNITSGSVRLAYKRMENRSFFLAIYRHVQFLARRGCWRTAFEFNKLLLSLDPTTDPIGSLLSIDFHALKAHEYAYFLRLHTHFNTSGSLSLLPSYAYSAAYARFKQESDKGAGDAEGRHEESIKLLQRAVCLFPGVVIPLMEKCGEKDSRVLDSAVLLACYAESPYLNLLIQLFVERNFALWKEPEVISWLKATTLSTISLLESATDPLVKEGLRLRTTDYSTTPIPLNLSRHVLISDYQPLLHFLPADVTSQSYHMYDPLPPLDSVSPYGNESGNGGVHDPQGMLMVMLRNLLPWGDQAAAGRDAGPRVMNGQRIGMLPRELAEQIEVFAAARGAANDGRVPGEFPGGEENAETIGEARDGIEGLDENFLGSLRRTAMAWLQAQTQGGAEEPPPPDENPEPHENGQP